MNIDNKSQWAYCIVPQWTIDRNLKPLLVVKTGYQWDDQGVLTPLPETDIEIEVVDRFYDDDAQNKSLAACNDMVPFKKGFELFLTGTAHSLTPTQSIMVGMALQDTTARTLWHKKCRVTGVRHWQRGLLGWQPSEPALFQNLAMQYEFAYGGTCSKNTDKTFRENPIGVGYKISGEQKSLPRIEQAPWLFNPKQSRSPAGFAALAPHWSPRLERLQSLDAEAAAQGACPYSWPVDPNLFNAAPEDQILTEPPNQHCLLQLQGLHPKYEVQTIALPKNTPQAQYKTALLPLVWDTLIIDADKQRLYQLWRVSIPITLSQLPSLTLTLSNAVTCDESEVA
ncbi:DUF2169 domain-containing protein [Reinekea sp.]|jgi:hypothetical protein|uniref:DUF2169 family type VI secretion system accessory protein n=1 Tax=Reinekea sp. TaxID=1970455 RepID=UPI003989ADEB